MMRDGWGTRSRRILCLGFCGGRERIGKSILSRMLRLVIWGINKHHLDVFAKQETGLGVDTNNKRDLEK